MNDVIQLNQISKKYGHFSLCELTFGIKEGYITGLIGPNGAGKTTLIKMMMGMVQPDQGSIEIFGKETTVKNAKYKERIGYVSDENYFYDQLTIDQMSKMIAPFYSQWDKETYRKYIEMFKLSPRKKIKELSKGMKMKYSLAIALSHGADLLIMDEPTAGLDPIFRRELLDLLSEHIQDEKKSILFSTHNTTDLDRIADYIVFVNEGRLVFNEMKESLPNKYMLVKGNKELLDRDVRKCFIGIRETALGFEGLLNHNSEEARYFRDQAICEIPTLEEIMYFTVKRNALYV
ncbi:ABC transporter ATP-binding protein [Paenibacillus pseudetheri]|uniref:Vitamin B12 import ATP-binding protein BtuD n=1 Tax=Paenibacillus pseudetheri TaxID=2897682 RepID=A0ABM9BD96_9BACL|nr:ABC transporter ATP-binding protein [Paenibacillus pseudetheri]CAH1056903.1 Vitamin B12 import ATP-binding protein BtuD [Paenibacillus pseudetheri]